MKLFPWKTVTKPKSNNTHEVPAAVLWYVRWGRKYGEYSHETEACIEAFPNKGDAHAFAGSLRAAYALLRYTSGTEVKVTCNRKGWMCGLARMNVFVEMVGGLYDGEMVTLSKTYAFIEFKIHVPSGEVVKVLTYDRRPDTLKYDYRGETKP